MMVRAGLVVAVAGATVILVALGGLMEIESRAGPYDQALAAESVPLRVGGSYRAAPAQGSQGPGGVCVPDSVGGACSPPRLEVSLRLQGLPRIGGGPAYVGFLMGPDTLRLGALREAGDAHSLEYREDRDGQAYTRLVVALELRPDAATAGPLVVYAQEVGGQGRNAPSSLDADRVLRLLDGEGRVRVAEIGAASISVTALGELAGVADLEGWVYQAWFQTNHADAGYIALGVFEFDAGGSRATLDARIETLRLEDQRRLLVTLEPAQHPVGDAPVGAPVFGADFAA